MNNTPLDLVDLEETIIDLDNIIMKIRDFYRIMDYSQFDAELRVRVVQARGVLDSARTLLKNKLMPEENEYIREAKGSYAWMVDNLNRCDATLDLIEKETIQQIENAISSRTNVLKSAKIMILIKTLNEYMEHLVYYPIKSSYQIFLKYPRETEKDGNTIKIKKDEKLFLYLLFLQLFHSSEALGGVARTPMKSSPRASGTVNQKPSTEIPPPPRIPINIEEEESEQTEPDDFFNEDFFKEEDYDSEDIE